MGTVGEGAPRFPGAARGHANVDADVDMSKLAQLMAEAGEVVRGSRQLCREAAAGHADAVSRTRRGESELRRARALLAEARLAPDGL